MAKTIVSLYIDDTSLRLMVSQGKQIKEWAESPLEPGLVENNVVVAEAEVAARIEQLFQARQVKTKKIIVGVSGRQCLTRPIILPQLPNEMLDEAVKREAQRTLPVPLEQLYISWQTIPAPEGKTKVFLVAIPRKTADALFKALNQAGLKPSFMELKPLLLARVVKETVAVIVDVQATEFDIVIMADGVPQPIRTVSLDSKTVSWQEKLAMIRNDLNRTIAFYNANNPENLLAASVPIFASGDLANELELCQTLSNEVGHPILPIPSPLESPDGFAPGRFMVNIGLALQESAKEAGPSVITLNTLPAPYQPKPISLTNILAPSGAAVAAGLLAFLVMLTQSTAADIAAIRVKLNTTEQLLQQRQAQRQELVGNIANVEKQITELEAARGNFAAALGSLERQSAGVNRDLELTIKSLPTAISLSSISHANGLLSISGRAESERQVLRYLMALNTSGGSGGITITKMSRIEDEGMNFTLLGSTQMPQKEISSIEVALSNLPASVMLTSFTSADGALSINGRSPDEDKVLLYLKKLEASGKFAEITITTMTKTEDGGTNFSLLLKIGG